MMADAGQVLQDFHVGRESRAPTLSRRAGSLCSLLRWATILAVRMMWRTAAGLAKGAVPCRRCLTASDVWPLTPVLPSACPAEDLSGARPWAPVTSVASACLPLAPLLPVRGAASPGRRLVLKVPEESSSLIRGVTRPSAASESEPAGAANSM